MKKYLLSLIALGFTALFATAQTWTEPEMPEPATVGSDPVSGHSYRIKNVQASQYFSEELSAELESEENVDACIAGGQVWFNWNTTAKLSTDEYEIIAFTLTQDTEGGWTMQCFDGNWVGKYMFISGNGIDGFAMHVDGGGPTKFELVKQTNGYYHIRAVASDGTYGKDAVADWENKCWTWRQGDEQPYAVYAALQPNEEQGLYGDWEFIDMNLHIYDAQMKLYNLALAIEDEELDVDYEAFTTAYESSDFEALTTALEQLSRLVGIARIDKYLKVGEDGKNPPSDDNPADATPLIQNPDFETGNIDGWTCTFKSGVNANNIGYQGATYNNGDVQISNFIEAWADGNGKFNPNVTFRALGDAELEQTMYNLPKGKYTFTCDAIAVQQDGQSKPCTGVQLFAIGGEADTFLEISTENNKPEHFEVTFASTGGDITLGLRTRNATANWIAADNFTLTYFGETTLDPAKIALDALIAKYVEQYGEEASDVVANKDIKAAYVAAMAAAIAATSDYATYGDNLNAAVADLRTSISEYETLAATIDEWDGKAAGLEGTKWAAAFDEIADKLDEMRNAYDAETYTGEQIEEACNGLGVAFAQTIGNLVEKGDDLTFLLQNPGFENDFSGWQVDPNKSYPGFGGTPVYYVEYDEQGEIADEVEITSGVAEVWRGTFDFYQTIYNMPQGLYTVSVKAFERNEDNQGDRSTVSELYAVVGGETQTVKTMNINDDATKESLFESSMAGEGAVGPESDKQNDEGKWIPNGRCGANVHFYKGGYENKFDIRVNEISDLVIGMRNSANNRWVLFDDFRIVYKGDDADAYLETVERLVAEAEKLLKQNEDGEEFFTTQALTQLDEAVQTGNSFIDDIQTATKEDAETAIKQLEAAIEYAKKSPALIQDIYDTTNEFNDMVQNSGIESNDTELAALLAEIYGLNDQYASNEQIEQYMAALPAKWVKFVLGQDGFAQGTEEDPFYISEAILNANFEADGSQREVAPPYWSVDAMGQNNGYQDNTTYTNDEEDIQLNQFVETWGNGAILKDGKISQTLAAALPEGYYRLEVDGKSTGNEGVYLWATNGQSEWKTLIDAEEDIPNHYVVDFYSDGQTLTTVGVLVRSTNSTWAAFDTFVLSYIGTTAPTAVEGIEADIIATPKTIAIYNLAGQRVQKAVRGVYVINGKKVIVK